MDYKQSALYPSSACRDTKRRRQRYSLDFCLRLVSPSFPLLNSIWNVNPAHPYGGEIRVGTVVHHNDGPHAAESGILDGISVHLWMVLNFDDLRHDIGRREGSYLWLAANDFYYVGNL